jgi:hypothetical protein
VSFRGKESEFVVTFPKSRTFAYKFRMYLLQRGKIGGI